MDRLGVDSDAIDHEGNDMLASMLLWLMIVGNAANKVIQYMQTKSSSLPPVMRT